MDELQPTTTSPEIPQAWLDELETSRKLLFEPDFVPPDFADMASGRLDPRLRAMSAMNNFDNTHLPGSIHHTTFSESPTEPFKPKAQIIGRDNMTNQDYLDDIEQALQKAGITSEALSEWRQQVNPSNDYRGEKLLEFYQTLFPAFEFLVKEKGYEPDFLKA